MTNIKDIIVNYISNWVAKEKFYSCFGTVTSVNEEAKVCDVELLTGETIQDVRLETDLSVSSSGSVTAKSPSGLVLIPVKGSEVTISFVNNTQAYVSMFSQVDKVYIKSNLCTFNSGDNGGLVNIVDQVTKLNGLVNELTAELVKIAAGITGAGGAYTPGTLSQFNKADFEDTKIEH